MAKLKNRVAIVSDSDGGWYVRRIRVVEHDLDKDEKVYRCDLPIGLRLNEIEELRFDTIEEAAFAAKKYLDSAT